MRSTLIIRTVARVLSPLVLTFGLYIILHGHLTPGGGFQGGAVVATGIALLMVAHPPEYVRKAFRHGVLNVVESGGALGFLGMAILGLMGYTFFRNTIANSGFLLFGEGTPYGINLGTLNTGGTLPYMNIFVGLKVMAGLSAIVLLFLLSKGGDGK
jgi:multicomponent Na+:H+ antiporter subunit B